MNEGAASDWAPFIDSLPDEHQCGYLLDRAAAQAVLQASVRRGHLHPDNASDWHRHQDECRASVREVRRPLIILLHLRYRTIDVHEPGVHARRLTHCAESAWPRALACKHASSLQALQAHDSILDALDVSLSEAEWAFGQVTSRSFSCRGRRLMVPLIDCLNHSPAAQKLCKWCGPPGFRKQVLALLGPAGTCLPAPAESSCAGGTAGKRSARVCRSQCGRLRYGCSHGDGESCGGAVATLRFGEELFLNYGAHYRLWDEAESHTPFQPCDPDRLVPELQAFTRWGFVPEHQ